MEEVSACICCRFSVFVAVTDKTITNITIKLQNAYLIQRTYDI